MEAYDESSCFGRPNRPNSDGNGGGGGNNLTTGSIFRITTERIPVGRKEARRFRTVLFYENSTSRASLGSVPGGKHGPAGEHAGMVYGFFLLYDFIV